MALVGPQLHNLQDHMENQIRTFFSGGWFPKVSSSRDGKCMYSVALLLKLVAQEKNSSCRQHGRPRHRPLLQSAALGRCYRARPG